MADSPIVVLYAVSVHEASSSGDLARMRQMEQDAQRYLDSVDGVKSALEDLRAEISRRSNS